MTWRSIVRSGMTTSSAGRSLVQLPFEDHITDWITNNTSKGLTLQSYTIEQLAIQVTGDIAIDHYRIKLNWTKNDTGEVARTDAMRITHTWIRTNGAWQIIGGMSAPVNAAGK